MVGVSEPRQGYHQNTITEDGFDPADDFPEQEAVGKEGKVMTMLLERSDRNHDRGISVEGLDGRPGHVCEFHEMMGVKLD